MALFPRIDECTFPTGEPVNVTFNDVAKLIERFCCVRSHFQTERGLAGLHAQLSKRQLYLALGLRIVDLELVRPVLAELLQLAAGILGSYEGCSFHYDFSGMIPKM